MGEGKIAYPLQKSPLGLGLKQISIKPKKGEADKGCVGAFPTCPFSIFFSRWPPDLFDCGNPESLFLMIP